jgi:acyl-coenzyme A synthetase/AMP-(fatty) acid ligase
MVVVCGAVAQAQQSAKVPRYLEYRGELPKTPSSKVQKNILRDESQQPSSKMFDRLRN